MSFEIRRLTGEDALRYGEVRLRMLRDHPESFGSSPSEIEGKTEADLRARFAERHSGEADFILAAESTSDSTLGEFLGTCGLYRPVQEKVRHQAEVWGVWTRDDSRRQGIARALIEETIRRARAVSELEILRISYSAANPNAGDLYRALGFEPWGVEPAALKLEWQGRCQSICEHHLSLALRSS